MKAILPYYGGKVKLSKQLIELIPPHKHYIEVFAGGLSMFFRKNKVEWTAVNDLSRDIANFWIVVGDEYLFNQFTRKVFYATKSRTYYEQIKKLIRDDGIERRWFSLPDVERAFRYYYFIRNSFNAQINSAFSKDVAGWTTNLEQVLKDAATKFDGVIVENMDYKKLIDKYEAKTNAFWYFDPPYTMAEGESYYAINFNKSEHAMMKKKLDHLVDVSESPNVMVSYDDSNMVRELYKDWHITEIPVKYSGNINEPDKEFVELVITNYKPEHSQEELF